MEQLLLLYIEPVTKNEHACEVLCCSKLAGVFFSVIM